MQCAIFHLFAQEVEQQKKIPKEMSLNEEVRNTDLEVEVADAPVNGRYTIKPKSETLVNILSLLSFNITSLCYQHT